MLIAKLLSNDSGDSGDSCMENIGNVLETFKIMKGDMCWKMHYLNSLLSFIFMQVCCC